MKPPVVREQNCASCQHTFEARLVWKPPAAVLGEPRYEAHCPVCTRLHEALRLKTRAAELISEALELAKQRKSGYPVVN